MVDDSRGLRREEARNSRLTCADAEIHVLREQVDSLVERPECKQKAPWRGDAGACEPARGDSALGAPRLTAIPEALGQEPRGKHRSEPDLPSGRLRTCRRLPRPIGIQDLRPAQRASSDCE